MDIQAEVPQIAACITDLVQFAPCHLANGCYTSGNRIDWSVSNQSVLQVQEIPVSCSLAAMQHFEVFSGPGMPSEYWEGLVEKWPARVKFLVLHRPLGLSLHLAPYKEASDDMNLPEKPQWLLH